MIKKYLLGLFVGFVGFIGFSFADNYDYVVIDLPGNFYTNNINNYITPALNFKNTDLDQVTHNWLYFQFGTDGSNARKYIFWNNGKLYFYEYFVSDDITIQGYYDKVCKFYSEDGTFEGYPCIDEEYQDISIFYNLTGYNFTKARAYPAGGVGNLGFYDSNSKYYYYFNVHFLTGSLNIPDNAIDISQYVNFSPFYNGNPSGDLTNVYCPTISQLIANYNMNGFSSGLCYSSSRIYNGSSFVSVDPKSIFELFSSKEDYISSLNRFATYCESSVYNSSVCAEAFSGEDLRFNLISKIPSDNSVLGGRKSLYTYCGLYNYDPNATTCVASGVLQEPGTDFNVDDVVNSISNGSFSVWSPNTDGTVFDNGSGYSYSGDIVSNIGTLFFKFTSLFKKQTSNSNGLLPSFILVPFIILVLFKLFKK